MRAVGELAGDRVAQAALALALDGSGRVRQLQAPDSERRSASNPGSGRGADSSRCAADSGTATAPRATAARNAGSRATNAGFRFAIPLR
jgi:hypothetical protein